MELTKCKLGELITQRREKNDGSDLPICGVSKDGLIPPKQKDADTSIYNVFYRDDFIFNLARMELNSIAINDMYDRAICSSLYEVFYVHRTDLLLPHYLKLIIRQKWFTRYCEFLGQGSAREYCRFGNISEIEIEFPPIEEQQKIVDYNTAIENRIALKQKINDNLQATAQAIYKKHFIEDVDVSKLPSDWRIDILENVANLSAGGDRPGTYSDYSTDICSIPIYSNGIENEGLYGFTDKAKIFDECVTVSARGTVGYVFLREEPYVPIVRLISVIPDTTQLTAKYLFFALNAIDLQSTGTSQQQITVPDFKKRQILIPSKEAINKFMLLIEPLFAAIKQNKIEINALLALQDNCLTILSR